MKINTNCLNTLEHKLYKKITEYLVHRRSLRIIDAASLCQISTSKISKMVKKMGFDNYKQFCRFITNKEEFLPKHTNTVSTEITRLTKYLENFKYEIVEQFCSILERYDKIILFGYGPSYICAEYLAYKLKMFTKKFVILSHSEELIINQADEKSVLVLFSVTGNFKPFRKFCQTLGQLSKNTVLLLEEYNTNITIENQTVFFLTKSSQDVSLLPYEKSRAIFFLFIEEVCFRLLEKDWHV